MSREDKIWLRQQVFRAMANAPEANLLFNDIVRIADRFTTRRPKFRSEFLDMKSRRAAIESLAATLRRLQKQVRMISSDDVAWTAFCNAAPGVAGAASGQIFPTDQLRAFSEVVESVSQTLRGRAGAKKFQQRNIIVAEIARAYLKRTGREPGSSRKEPFAKIAAETLGVLGGSPIESMGWLAEGLALFKFNQAHNVQYIYKITFKFIDPVDENQGQ